MVEETENRNRPLALILTIIYHGLLLLLFLLVIFKTPIPPYPTVGGGGGLEVNFGTSANGMGTVQPEQYIPIDIKIMKQQMSQRTTASGKEEEIMTQQTEEGPVIKTGVLNKKKKKQKELYTEKEPKKTTEIQINDPVVNPLALYKKKPKGASEGETGKPGDQGNPNGTMYSKNHYGEGGSGGGTGGGNGTGNGPGNGSGSGPGTGTLRGVNYSLAGRTQRYLPKPPSIALQHQEIVVVTIWVDKTGNVTRVNVGEKGTTATDQRLYKIAEEYALKSKFNSNPQAKEVQKGNITYIFTPASQ
jgi:hypothetical protein